MQLPIPLMEAVHGLISAIQSDEDNYLTEESQEALNKLREAVAYNEYQAAKYAQKRFVKIKKCLRMKARAPEGRNTIIVVEPGDKGRVIGNDAKLDNLLIESTDPARLVYKLPICEERRTWEFIGEENATRN